MRKEQLKKRQQHQRLGSNLQRVTGELRRRIASIQLKFGSWARSEWERGRYPATMSYAQTARADLMLLPGGMWVIPTVEELAGDVLRALPKIRVQINSAAAQTRRWLKMQGAQMGRKAAIALASAVSGLVLHALLVHWVIHLSQLSGPLGAVFLVVRAWLQID